MKKYTTWILILTALLLCLSHAAADSWDIRLPEELTVIEEYAFAGDTSLNTVYVGDNVTTIGSRAFANSSLRDIRLPETLTELAPDAFVNIPHVEVYGTWYPDFLDGMDNVSMSGAELTPYGTSMVSAAAGQEVVRKVSLTLTGEWYFEAANCSGAVLCDSEGEIISDFTFESDVYSLCYESSQTEDVYLCICNETDALVEAEVRIVSPLDIRGIVSTMQAEYKGGALLDGLFAPQWDFNLNNPDPEDSLHPLEAHQYFAPAVRVQFNGEYTDIDIKLIVDGISIKHWNETLYALDTAASESFAAIYDYLLEPEDVMKFNGFDAGEHTVHYEVNGTVVEYTYEITGYRKLQSIGQDVSSLYLLPNQHVFASFTAETDGVYTIQSDIPAALQIYGRLIDDEGNILDSKEEANEEYDFCLSADLAEGQTITLEAWIDQPEEGRPFYGVVTLIVDDPSADGENIFENATCRALVIGQTYETAPDRISRLPGCRNDADSMAAMLANLSGTPYAVSQQMNLDAKDILAAIPAAFADATEDDVSLFYYSGHGATGSGALVGNDDEYVTPEMLKKALDAVPGTKIILLDSCFSGYLIGRGSEEAAKAQAALEHFMSVFSFTGRGDGSQYFVLTASSLYETSIGYTGACSLFTGALLNGMEYDPDNNAAPADANHDGMFTLDELFVYCRNTMRHTMLGQTVCPWPYNCDQVLFIDNVQQE